MVGRMSAAPDPPEWFLGHPDGNTYGPFTAAQLRQMAVGGQITPATPILQQSSGVWTTCGEVGGLTFPPPPPSAPASPAAAPPDGTAPRGIDTGGTPRTSTTVRG